MLSFFKKKENGQEGNGKFSWLILIVAAVGVVLLLWGGQDTAQKEEKSEEIYSPAEDELVLYQVYLEERVKALCESVDGVFDVTVIITLAGGFEQNYATELINGDEEYVIIGSGSSAQGLLLSRDAPQIAGIGIVCRGGSNAAVKQELTALISASFHISSNRIYIAEAKK